MKLHNFLVMLFLLTGAILFVACEGERGPAGKDGVDGKDGAKGEKGEKGDPGEDGAPGTAGAKGDDGTTGDPRCDRSNGINVGASRFLQGTADDDVLCANEADNHIEALGGDDVVYGGGGRDILVGGEGNDTLYGEGGSDHFFLVGEAGDNKIVGGEGKDMVYCYTAPNLTARENSFGNYSNTARLSALSATLDLSSGSFDGSAFPDSGSFTFEGIEDVFCGNGHDTLTGDDQNNYLFGGYGNDTLIGAGGDDVLAGSSGNDTFNGGSGSDFLWGSDGTDTFTGGSGADTIVIAYYDSPDLKVITDFNVAEDKIILAGFFATGENARAITRDGAKIKVGGTAFVEIHDANGASTTQATAIINKKGDVFRFAGARFLPKTRTYDLVDQ